MSDDVMIQDDQQESAAETPADYEVTIGGVVCKMIYLGEHATYYSGDVRPTYKLEIPFAHFDQVFAVLPHMPEVLSGVNVTRFSFNDPETNSSEEAVSLSYLTYHVRERRAKLLRDKVAAEYAQKVQDIEKRVIALERSGQVLVSSDLRQSVRKLSGMLGWRMLEHHRSGALTSCIRHIEKELERLETTSPREEFIKALVDGDLGHRHAYENKLLIDQVRSMSIRTGGLVDPITHDVLERFYRGRIATVSTHDELVSLDLRLDPTAYMPDEEMLDDPDLELAPEQVSLPGNKGEAAYRITYGLTKQGDSDVPTGTIEVPLSVYEKLAPEYGKKSGFPTLPHNIQLNIKVTCDGKLLAEGIDSLELADKVRKAEKARGRSKHADQVFLEDRGEVPPWYQGANKPGRRR
jgi:hypothetical protein